MNILEEFKSHLLHSKKKHSKATIKNYIADINKFIKWSEENPQSKHNPSKITPETIEIYKLKLNRDKISPSSIDRYLSSLRLYFTFLKSKSLLRENPLNSSATNSKPDTDPLLLKNFKLSLLDQNISKVTIKNYLMDISQFTQWLTNQSQTNEINSSAINEYKHKLINVDHLAPASVNRKFSSIRKYLNFLSSQSRPLPTPFLARRPVHRSASIGEPVIPAPSPLEGWMAKPDGVDNSPEAGIQLHQNTDEKLIHKSENPITTGSNEKSDIEYLLKNQAQNYQKINENKKLLPIDILILPIVKIIESIEYTIWKLKGGKLFKSIPKEEIKNKTPHDKSLYYKIRHTRPTWYTKYHSYPITNYIHISILLLFTTILGINLYKYFYNNDLQQKPIIASPANSPPKTLSFHGKLTDANNNPITAETPLRFSLYNNEFSSGSAMLWQETQTITPDKNGQFTTTLGQKSPMSSDTFTNNPNLFLGMTIGKESELKPRQQLATLGLSKNAEQVGGLIPITENGAGTSNVLLALDSAGNLTIGGTASPTFQATGGSFTLSGKTLILKTTSNNNIELSPDGNGIIDLKKPIQNTTNNNNILSAKGAVEIDDLLAILATSSGQSALTINQNGGGPIISASSSGIAKFTLENNGTGTFAGNIISNGDTFNSGNTSFNLLNTTSTIAIGANTGTTTINNTLIARGGLTIPSTRSLIVSGNVASNLNPFANDKYDLGSITNQWNNAYIKNLKASASIIIDNPGSGSGNLFSASSSDTTRFTINQNGLVGVNGSLCVNTTGTCTASASAGTIYATNTTVQNADLAENYISSQYLEPGDIIIPEGKGNNLSVIKASSPYDSKTIGIVSTKPGITLNSGAATDANHPYIAPIALAGRVPVKVTTAGGNIKAGDEITTSSIPGVGMKATKSGTIIGKALEDYTNPDPATTGKILIFVNLSYSTGPNETYNLLDNKIKEINSQLIQDFSFTADNISLGGQTLKEYISNLIQSTVQKEIARQLPALPTPVNPLATDSASLASPSAAYITNITNIYQTTASNEASISTTLQATNSAVLSATKSATLSATNSANIASASASTDTPAPPATQSTQIDNQSFLELFKKSEELTNNYSNLASISSLLQAPHGLMAFGPSTLSDVAIAGNLNINGSLILANNSINTLGSNLQLQSLRQGNLSIMAGLVSIDTNGNLKVKGNATFAKNVTIHGTLQAKIIAPIPESDLRLKLNNNSNLTIQNTSGNNNLTINHLGDIASSGSGKFANLAIIRNAQADNSLTQTTASSSAGTAVISTHETERTIINPFVKEDSLIYLTATSDTRGLTPYIARQTKDSFTISIPYAINSDIKINWWIIN
jgi:site-specific recombinase XerD